LYEETKESSIFKLKQIRHRYADVIGFLKISSFIASTFKLTVILLVSSLDFIVVG